MTKDWNCYKIFLSGTHFFGYKGDSNRIYIVKEFDYQTKEATLIYRKLHEKDTETHRWRVGSLDWDPMYWPEATLDPTLLPET